MKKRKIQIFVIIIISIIIGYVGIISFDEYSKQDDNIKTEFIVWDHSEIFKILVDPSDIILYNGKQIPLKATFGLIEGLESTYDEIGFIHEDSAPLFIIPTFTLSAYSENGFYDFYSNECDKQCLTTKIIHEDKFDYSSSANAIKILKLLGYNSITDIDLHTNPKILENHEKIIVLHNEYVSKEMFGAITSHPNVVFLYPNALYAEIEVNLEKNQISLIRGHNYPEEEITNGFGWENDNTHPYEYDSICEDWNFYSIKNGHMLNCYPEQLIWKNAEFLKKLKEL